MNFFILEYCHFPAWLNAAKDPVFPLGRGSAFSLHSNASAVLHFKLPWRFTGRTLLFLAVSEKLSLFHSELSNHNLKIGTLKRPKEFPDYS